MPVRANNPLLPLSVKAATPFSAFQDSQTRGIQNELLQARTGEVEQRGNAFDARADFLKQQTDAAAQQAAEQTRKLAEFESVVRFAQRISPLINAAKNDQDLFEIDREFSKRIEDIDSTGGNSKDSVFGRSLVRSGDVEGLKSEISKIFDMRDQLRAQGIGVSVPGQDKSQGDPAQIQAFKFLSEASTEVGPDGQPTPRALQAQTQLGTRARAGLSAEERIAQDDGLGADVADQAAQEAAAKETGKLSAQLKLKPEVDAAVNTAVAQATLSANAAKENRSNQRALQIYDVAMKSLAGALGDTFTGPIVGLMPAITANAQIADGAIAAIAPVMKQLFRSAGEGIFTDKDQELLLAMVPSRTDHPKARAAKLLNIDAIVRAKLAPLPTDNTGSTAAPAQQAQETEQPIVIDFNDLPQ